MLSNLRVFSWLLFCCLTLLFMVSLIMDRFSYQVLRANVETEIVNFDFCKSDSGALVNSVMRLVLQAISAEQVKSQVSRRQLLTFRRDDRIKAPSWAYRGPVNNDRLPTL